MQMSTMIDSRFSEMRQSFLNTNKLLAVCSLPPLLFHPEAAVITSLVIFEKGTPNQGNKTWFATLKMMVS